MIKKLLIKILLIQIYFFIFMVHSSDFYNFTLKSISGEALKMENFRHKVVLLVNTASMCGFTKQYAGLQDLYDNYKDKGLVVIGIPSNSFMQEYGKDEKVKDFCETKFDITFPMSEIINVAGDEVHPLYKWLKENHGFKPRWNFYKVILDRNGNYINSFSSLTKPNSQKLLKIIQNKLDG